MNNLKILLALNSFFPEKCAGTEVYVLGLARFLREQKHDIAIVVPSSNGFNSSYEFDGFNVYQYPISKITSAKKINNKQNQDGIDSFLKILSTLNPDVIHFHSFNRAMNSNHIKSAHDMGIKTVFTSHLAGLFCARGDLFYKNKKICDGKIRLHRCMSCYLQQKFKLSFFSEIAAFWINLLTIIFPLLNHYRPSLSFIKYKKNELRKLNKYCDKIISISKWMVNTYHINGVADVAAVYQKVSDGLGSGKVHAFLKNRINLIFVGRLYPIKNIDLLLDVLLCLDRTKFDLTMIVIPDKNSMDYYHKIKGKYELLGYTKWHEKIPAEKVKEFLKLSDLLCLPSKSEVAPMVIKEAFDCGTPVLGSDIPPIKELVTNEQNGLLFETNNFEFLKKQLDKLITDRELLYTLKDNVLPMTDIVKVYKTIEKQYQLLMSSKKIKLIENYINS